MHKLIKVYNVIMKKIIINTIALTTIVASFANMQNLNNKKKYNITNPNFQLQLVIANYTSNIGPGATNYEGHTWFYLDIVINGITYTTYDFTNIVEEERPFDDTFKTECSTTKIIYTLNLNPSLKYVHFDFNFGTIYPGLIFPAWFHAPLKFASNDYDFHKTYNDTKNNGTQIVITATGSGGNNRGDWGYKYYKF